MSLYLNTLGNSSVAVGICDRCRFKFPIVELESDPNYPGLRVCRKDRDQFDPYRLPARQTENIIVRFPRPDAPLTGFVAGLSAPLQTQDGLDLLTQDGLYLLTQGD